MKIALFSDLHTEFDKREPWLPSPLDVDVLVFAGDNVTSQNQLRAYAEAVERVQANVAHILYVCGNHEFYGSFTRFGERDYEKYREALADCPRSALLEMESIYIGGVRFVGATMWTPVEDSASREFNDYRYIRIDRPPYRRLTPADVRARYQQTVQFLKAQSQSSDTTVVVTHHPPSTTGLGIERGDPWTANLDELIEEWQPRAWLHGHVHRSHTDTIGTTRILSNPRGYFPNHLNSDFDSQYTFDI